MDTVLYHSIFSVHIVTDQCTSVKIMIGVWIVPASGNQKTVQRWVVCLFCNICLLSIHIFPCPEKLDSPACWGCLCACPLWAAWVARHAGRCPRAQSPLMQPPQMMLGSVGQNLKDMISSGASRINCNNKVIWILKLVVWMKYAAKLSTVVLLQWKFCKVGYPCHLQVALLIFLSKHFHFPHLLICQNTDLHYQNIPKYKNR